MADLNPDDAKNMGIAQDDVIEISTPAGSVTVCANLSYHNPPGLVSLYHDYREANFNNLVDCGRLDPYSGFPAVRSNRCRVAKKGDFHEKNDSGL